MDSIKPIEHARQLMGQDRLEQAEQTLRELFVAGDRSFALIIELAHCHLMLGDDSQARKYLAMAESIDDGHTRVACYRGFLALVEGHHTAALRDFARSLEADPNNAEAYKWRGLCHRELDEPERALADFDRAVAHLRQDATLLINRGTVQADLGRFGKALDDFRRAAEASPWHPLPHSNAGHVLVELGRLEEAQEAYDSAIEIDHATVEAWMGLTEVSLARSDPSEGLRCLATALALEPEHPDAMLKAGRLLIELGLTPQGIAYLDRALEAQPPDADTLTYRAIGQYHQGDFGACLRDVSAALGHEPEHGLALLYRGLVRAQAGAVEEAVVDLLQSRSLLQRHPLPSLALAEVAWTRGEWEVARGHLREALSLDPRLSAQLREVTPFAELQAGLADGTYTDAAPQVEDSRTR